MFLNRKADVESITKMQHSKMHCTNSMQVFDVNKQYDRNILAFTKQALHHLMYLITLGRFWCHSWMREKKNEQQPMLLFYWWNRFWSNKRCSLMLREEAIVVDPSFLLQSLVSPPQICYRGLGDPPKQHGRSCGRLKGKGKLFFDYYFFKNHTPISYVTGKLLCERQ